MSVSRFARRAPRSLLSPRTLHAPRHSSPLTSLPFLILSPPPPASSSSSGVLSSFLSSGRWFRANRVSRRAYVIMDVARSKVRGKVRRSSSVIGGTFRPPASVIFEDSHCPRRSNQPESPASVHLHANQGPLIVSGTTARRSARRSDARKRRGRSCIIGIVATILRRSDERDVPRQPREPCERAASSANERASERANARAAASLLFGNVPETRFGIAFRSLFFSRD